MIIENPDAFKSWLTSILEPLCDADPAALAKYVYALVKKDKPLGELRDGMLDQLDVFLQHETKPFVDMLFKSLETQEYLAAMSGEMAQDAERPPSPPQAEGENAEVAPAHVENGKSERVSPPRARSPGVGPGRGARVVLRNKPAPPAHAAHAAHPAHAAHAPLPAQAPPRPLLEQTLVKASLPLSELLEEPVEQPPRRRDRRGDSLREGGGGGPERRRRRSRSWERRARRRNHRDNEHERRRPISRSPTERGRYRNRSPPNNERELSRSRSRSPPGMLRDRDRDRVVREADRDRASRDRDHRDRELRDRAGRDERDRSREREREPSLERAGKRRCRDFDEKGYCMRGDLCQWDHGADPVVLEDAALSRVLLLSPHAHPTVPEYNPLTPDIWSVGGVPPPYPPPHPPHLPHPPRELIPIPRVRHVGALPAGGAPPPRHPAPPKNNFDYNRIGCVRPPMAGGGAGGNCSLEVKKVPRGLNDITHLNNHFSKFGKIVNIQVCFNKDPEGALITFSTPAEANVAYKSTEAVLNNRFIKVFWHNPEAQNKQDNNNASKPPERAANQHPLSHNKVLINRVQPTQAAQAAKELKLAKEDAAARLSRLQIAQKKPKTREEAQKEILDAELDMFTKQQEGQDVTDLAKRIAELRRQMALQYPHPNARRMHSRGGRFSTSRINRVSAPAPKVFNNQVVDHRPRTLLVSGFEPDEVDAVQTHFAQYGEITGKEVDLAVPTLALQYAARAQAEQAMQRAHHYNDRTLTITWVPHSRPIGVAPAPPAPPAPLTPLTPLTPAHNGDKDDNKDSETASVSTDILLEEEEDDEKEDRSWRR